jgi:HEAT repeat protein
VAADSLYFHHQDPKIVKAVRRALAAERVPLVKATLLRQACWRWSSWIEELAIGSLGGKSPELVRAESASCLGRHLPAAKRALAPLRRALKNDPSPRVKGNLCAALAGLQDTASVPLLAAQLELEGVAWRCGTALAALGTRPAYQALKRRIAGSLRRGKPFPAQHLAALASFASKPFFERDRVLTLLEKVAGDRRLGWLSQKRAVEELGKLDGEQQLRQLRERYKDRQTSAGNHLMREIERWLSPEKKREPGDEVR